MLAPFTRPFVREVQYYEDRVQGLMSARDAGEPNTLAQIRSWHPDFAVASDDEIRGPGFAEDEARLVYARQHGFETWELFARHIDALARGSVTEPFLAAFDALSARDVECLQRLLREHPDLATARGTNDNTLLNLAASFLGQASSSACRNGGSSAHTAARAMVTIILEAGANVNQPNNRGWTPLHQAGYGNDPWLAEQLIAAGALLDKSAHGDGGTPLAAALFWGHRQVSDVLASRGVVPSNLRIAAGLGRADLVAGCFETGVDRSALTRDAYAGRGFYRPHSGFPIWHPSNNPQEILDEALVWASKANRVEVLPALVARGANVNADPYRGTPLVWSASKGRLETARWLLTEGRADVNARSTFGGPSHGQGVTALHLAASGNHITIVELLLAHGADVTLKDDLYHGTATGWAEHSGASAAAALLTRGA